MRTHYLFFYLQIQYLQICLFDNIYLLPQIVVLQESFAEMAE